MSAQRCWLWLIVPWQVVCELVSGKVRTLCLDSGIVSPLRLRWIKGVCMFRCNLPLALLAEWPGSFMCHCSNMGVKWTPNKSQHTKLTRRRKFFLCSHQDSNSLSNMSAALYQQTISAPKICSTLSISFIILSKTLITAWNLMPLQPHMVTSGV